MSQTAQALAQTLPLIPDIFSQLGRSIVLMQETLPLLRQTLPQIAQSLAQIPVVLPQLQREFAASHRSLPQTLSLLANLKLNVGQN